MGRANRAAQATKAALQRALVGGSQDIIKTLLERLARSLLDAETFSANEASVEALCQRIDRLMNILSPLTAPSNQSSRTLSPALSARLQDLSEDVQNVNLRLHEVIKPHNHLSRITRGKQISLQLEQLNKSLEDSLEDFFIKGSISVEEIVSAVASGKAAGLSDPRQESNSRHVKSMGSSDVDSSLPLPKADAHYSSTMNTATSCLEGTRVDVLKRINDWIKSTDADCPSVFWLNGAAGTGKSTIAQTIAEEADAATGLAASFFFSRNDSDRSEAQLFFTTIAYQLAHFKAINPTYREKIKEVLSTKPTIGRDVLRYQFRELFVKPLEGMHTHQPLIIVVDALDECADDRGAAEILLLLSQLFLSFRSGVDVPKSIRILVSSRPAHHLSSRFQTMITSSISDHLVLHDIETNIVRDDIIRYLRFHLTEIATQFSLRGDWPTAEQVEDLADKAAGLFIFAATAVKFIRDSRDPKQQLRFLLAKGPAASFLSRQANLDWLYLQILNNSMRPSDGPRAFQDFKDVVGAIVLLRDMMSGAELAAFLKVSVSRVDNTVMFLHAVILVPESAQFKIRLLHPSFPEYLTNSERCRDSRFYIHQESHHARLAQHCFSHMLASLRRDICGIGHPSRLNADVEDLDIRLRNRFPAELRYSCCSWAFHVSKCKPDTVQHSLKTFCETHLLTWLEAMSLLGEIDQGLISLNLMATWCKRASVDEFTSQLLDDGLRLLLLFTDPIRLSASHVYYSALAFAPPSLLLSTYSSELFDSVRVIWGLPDKWESVVRVFDEYPGSNYQATSLGAAFSPDGRQILTYSSSASAVSLWDFNSGRLLDTYDHPNDRPNFKSAVFSNDGSRIAIDIQDDATYIWNVAAGTLINRFPNPYGKKLSQGLAFSWDNALVARPSLEKLEVFDVSAGCTSATFALSEPVQAPDPVQVGSSVAFSPDISEPGYRLAVGRSRPQPSCCIFICNTENGTMMELADESNDLSRRALQDIDSVQYSSDGSLLVASMFEDKYPTRSGPNDDKHMSRSLVRIWDVASGQCIRRILSPFLEHYSSLHLLPNGTQLATSGGLWSLESGNCIRQFSINKRVLSFSPDTSVYLALNGNRGGIAAYRTISTPEVKLAVLASRRPILSKILDGLSVSRATRAQPDSLEAPLERLLRQMTTTHWKTAEVTAVAALHWGSNQSALLCGLNVGSILVLDVSRGRLHSVINDGTNGGRICTISVAPNNHYFASCQNRGSIAVWDAKTYTCLHKTTIGHIPGLDVIPKCIVFPPNWQMGMPLAVTLFAYHVACLWNPSTGSWVAAITSDDELLPMTEQNDHCCAFSKDGGTLFRPITPETISHVWDAAEAGILAAASEEEPRQASDLLLREADIFIDQGWLFLRRLDPAAARWNSWERACWIPPELRPNNGTWCSTWRSGNLVTWDNAHGVNLMGLHHVIIDVTNRLR